MGFVDTIRNSINSFLKGKRDNSISGTMPYFSSTTNLGTAQLKSFLQSGFHSYSTTLSIGEKNTVI
ncbi:hypothetical protein D8B45_06160, partial [Candidatus Gracilibacteria bacterium]